MDAEINTETADVSQEILQVELGSILWEKLRDGDYESAINEIREDKYQRYLIHNSLDLVPIITKFLQEDLDVNGEKCVEDLLVHIASVANAKEAVLVFMEELDTHTTEIHFRVILHPIQIILLRQASRNTRPITFSWVFNAIYSHVAAMNLPSGYNLEGKERKLLDVHPEVQAICKALRLLVDFYEVFYKKVIDGELIWTGKVTSSREFLSRFLLQLFHKPFTYLDVFCNNGEAESSLYRTCNEFTNMIASLLCNTFKLFSSITWNTSKTILAKEENNEEKETKHTSIEDPLDFEDGGSEKNDEISQLSLASFFYCVLSQDMASDYVPCVYSHQYVFLSCLPLIANLLQEKEHIPIHKGLSLAKAILNKLPEKSLSSQCLEAKAHSSFPQLLIRIMIYCDNLELRTSALNTLRSYLRKFDSVGRRKLIQALLLSVKHAGVLGLVIHELKENIAFSLSQDTVDPYFSGNSLVKLVQMACFLPDAEETDLLEWSDCIMAALNLLIFVFIRDKENKTGIREVLPVLQKGYLQQLQRGLDITKGHYELRLRDLNSSLSQEFPMDMKVCVGGSVLPSMSPDQEKKIIETAICSLDMMQCVLARVTQSTENTM
ncbi:glomulin-like isoform X1 [Homarus americanus]|uniref:Glomulin-like n=1 Tax=Homarus americanus TaxID=6706 RepID=A0A8J5JVS0_HOMAM|nr:glomulin-like isoform X1 [Homarus americanus]KAG7163143.1 Glomulin-like [Homarus americanus]